MRSPAWYVRGSRSNIQTNRQTSYNILNQMRRTWSELIFWSRLTKYKQGVNCGYNSRGLSKPRSMCCSFVCVLEKATIVKLFIRGPGTLYERCIVGRYCNGVCTWLRYAVPSGRQQRQTLVCSPVRVISVTEKRRITASVPLKELVSWVRAGVTHYVVMLWSWSYISAVAVWLVSGQCSRNRDTLHPPRVTDYQLCIALSY